MIDLTIHTIDSTLTLIETAFYFKKPQQVGHLSSYTLISAYTEANPEIGRNLATPSPPKEEGSLMPELVLCPFYVGTVCDNLLYPVYDTL